MQCILVKNSYIINSVLYMYLVFSDLRGCGIIIFFIPGKATIQMKSCSSTLH